MDDDDDRKQKPSLGSSDLQQSPSANSNPTEQQRQQATTAAGPRRPISESTAAQTQLPHDTSHHQSMPLLCNPMIHPRTSLEHLLAGSNPVRAFSSNLDPASLSGQLSLLSPRQQNILTEQQSQQDSLSQLMRLNALRQAAAKSGVQTVPSAILPAPVPLQQSLNTRYIQNSLPSHRPLYLMTQSTTPLGNLSIPVPMSPFNLANTNQPPGFSASLMQHSALTPTALASLALQSSIQSQGATILGLPGAAGNNPQMLTNLSLPMGTNQLSLSAFAAAPPSFSAPIAQDISLGSSQRSLRHEEMPRRSPDVAQSYQLKLPTTTKGPESSGGTPSRKMGKLDEKWMINFRLLEEYKRKHGDCIVPRGYSLNPKLASWVAEQRKLYKSFQRCGGSLTQKNRIDMLSSLSFTWDAQEEAWNRNLADLRRFRTKHGHCNVPLNDGQYPKLGLWVKEQRRHYMLRQRGQRSHITSARIEALEELDFYWDSLERTWKERYEELVEYKRIHGDCNVPANASGAYDRLATWVQNQRRQYRSMHRHRKAADDSSSVGSSSNVWDGEARLSSDRIQKLESLGLDWDPRNRMGTAFTTSASSAN